MLSKKWQPRPFCLQIFQCQLLNEVPVESAVPAASFRGVSLRVVFLAVLVGGFSINTLNAATNSIARIWDERALAAIRVDTPHPPAQARNYFSLSVCMYDAWAVYDTNAIGYVYRAKHTAPDIAAARREAISYAAWRLLKERHVYSKTAASTLAADDVLMASLGYDTNNVSRDTSTPAGVGNSVYDAVSAWFINDGANQAAGTPYPKAIPPIAYPDYTASQGGYVYINSPLATSFEGITDGSNHTVVDINHWQRLQIVNSVDQNGFPQGPLQSYLGAQWLRVRPFCLSRTDSTKPWIDPGPPPFFGTASHAQFIKEAVANITADIAESFGSTAIIGARIKEQTLLRLPFRGISPATAHSAARLPRCLQELPVHLSFRAGWASTQITLSRLNKAPHNQSPCSGLPIMMRPMKLAFLVSGAAFTHQSTT